MPGPIRIGLTGGTGRMGREIAALAQTDNSVTITGAVGRSSAAELPGLAAACNVLIDFSTPDGAMAAASAAVTEVIPLVTGTTGMTADQVGRLREASTSIPVWYARNMSTGISLLQRILPEIARALTGYDIEVVEMHHRHKVDAPSGTALMLVEALAAGPEGEQAHVYGRSGHAPRAPGDIGLHSVRGGGNVGEHTLIFASDEEEIRISHRALTRSAFAAGAIRAAKAIHGQSPGWYGPE